MLAPLALSSKLFYLLSTTNPCADIATILCLRYLANWLGNCLGSVGAVRAIRVVKRDIWYLPILGVVKIFWRRGLEVLGVVWIVRKAIRAWRRVTRLIAKVFVLVGILHHVRVACRVRNVELRVVGERHVGLIWILHGIRWVIRI